MVWCQQPDHKCIIQHTTRTVLFIGPAFILIKVVAVNLASEHQKKFNGHVKFMLIPESSTKQCNCNYKHAHHPVQRHPFAAPPTKPRPIR